VSGSADEWLPVCDRRQIVIDACSPSRSLLSTMNLDKFVIDCKGNQKAKFGFGEYVNYYGEHTAQHFAANKDLFSEICNNICADMREQLSPLNYWCVYLQSLQLRDMYYTQFQARDDDIINRRCNILPGCSMSINHYQSLLLYSNNTKLQRELKLYARKLNNDESICG
jgi:hypothetical protein